MNHIRNSLCLWFIAASLAHAETLAELRAKANKSDPSSQFQLGEIYQDGAIPKGRRTWLDFLPFAMLETAPAKDPVEAVKWFRLAADQGYAPAQISLGCMYASGEGGLPKDEKAAEILICKGAEQNPTFQKQVACMYSDGFLNRPPDEKEALKWWRKAAEHDDIEAQMELGNRYASGTGAPKDEAEAAKWIRKVAEHGDLKSQRLLAMRYVKGLGVDLNKPEAARWFRAAADQNDPESQYQLGMMYANGEGLTKNETEAHVWLNLAGANGVKAARDLRRNLEMAMTAEQKAAALKRAGELFGHLKPNAPLTPIINRRSVP